MLPTFNDRLRQLLLLALIILLGWLLVQSALFEISSISADVLLFNAVMDRKASYSHLYKVTALTKPSSARFSSRKFTKSNAKCFFFSSIAVTVISSRLSRVMRRLSLSSCSCPVSEHVLQEHEKPKFPQRYLILSNRGMYNPM